MSSLVDILEALVRSSVTAGPLAGPGDDDEDETPIGDPDDDDDDDWDDDEDDDEDDDDPLEARVTGGGDLHRSVVQPDPANRLWNPGSSGGSRSPSVANAAARYASAIGCAIR